MIDFKENYKCWKSKEQDADSFRNGMSVTIFNATIFLSLDSKTIQAHNWTFCSDNLTHDSFFVKEALSQLFRTQEFKRFDLKEISFWMDGGPHFRSHELNAFFINLQTSNFFKKVKWNHFIEYHGKNYCDIQFSIVSHILKVNIT